MTTTYSTGYPEADAWIARMYRQLSDEYHQQVEDRRQERMKERSRRKNRAASIQKAAYENIRTGNVTPFRGMVPFFWNQDGSLNRGEIEMMGMILEMRDAKKKWKEIAQALTDAGYQKRRGGDYTDDSVSAVYFAQRDAYDALSTL